MLNLKPLDPVTTNTSIRNVSYTGIITLATLFGQLHPTMEDGNPLYSASAPTGRTSRVIRTRADAPTRY